MTTDHLSASRLIETIVGDIAILDETNVGPPGAPWRDIIDTLAVNLEVLAMRMHRMRRGEIAKDLPALADITNGIARAIGQDAATELFSHVS